MGLSTDLSDKIIEALKDKKFVFGNGNVLLFKPPIENKTSGGIFKPDMATELENKQRNFARILTIPKNLDPDSGDLNLKIGDYCFYTFVAENPIHRESLQNILGVDLPKETICFTTDAEIVCTIPAEVVHARA